MRKWTFDRGANSTDTKTSRRAPATRCSASARAVVLRTLAFSKMTYCYHGLLAMNCVRKYLKLRRLRLVVRRVVLNGLRPTDVVDSNHERLQL
jgi:hypothetical protein